MKPLPGGLKGTRGSSAGTCLLSRITSFRYWNRSPHFHVPRGPWIGGNVEPPGFSAHLRTPSTSEDPQDTRSLVADFAQLAIIERRTFSVGIELQRVTRNFIMPVPLEDVKMLPVEMWHEILKELDALDLVRLKSVSTIWHDIIERIIKVECKWYKKCLEDIPRKHWTSILEHHPKAEAAYRDVKEPNKHSDTWLSMYRSWVGWNTMLNGEMWRKSCKIGPKGSATRITSLSASGNIIITGAVYEHCGGGGQLVAFDLSKFERNPFFVKSRVGRSASKLGTDNVQVWRKDNDATVISSNSTVFQHFNLRSGQKTREASYFETIQTSTNLGYCYTLKQLYSRNNPGEEFMRRLTLTMEKQPGRENSRCLEWWEPFNQSYTHAFLANGHKVILLSEQYLEDCQVLYEVSLETGKFKALSEIHRVPEHPTSPYRMFKPCVIAWLDEYHWEIRFSVSGRRWKIYHIHRDLKVDSMVTSFFYHLGLLILGLASGKLCIINVKDDDNLERLDLDSMPYKVIGLDECPIKHIAVAEYDNVQYIVAATCNRLHLVKSI